METWQWLILGILIFLLTAYGSFVVFNAFAGTGQQAGGSIAQQLTDTLFGWLG